MTAYKQLKAHFTRLYHLQNVQQLMSWDESVMMPDGAGQARAKVMATLSRTSQKMLIQKKLKPLIANANLEADLSLWDSANLKWMDKQHNLASCIPLKLTGEFTEASFASQQMWRKLRSQNNWQDFLPYLEKTFRLTKDIAERKSQILGLHPYDALLDEYAPGFNQRMIDQTFSGLKAELPLLIKKIIQQQANHKIIHLAGPFSIEKQKNIVPEIVKALGFDFAHGRIDVSHHPFCGGDGSDTRMTTRYNEADLLSSILGICHETGHALYEQGLPKKWLFQPVGHVNSMAMHESQSLFMEMEVCRSLEFFEYLSSIIQNEFGEQAALSANNLYQHVTHVDLSYIRVDADEVTYPMHIILRYEIEKELFSGKISIKDLPARWNELMMKYLQLSTLNNDKDGVMQDVHWPCGSFGYFPAYTLGRMIAAQLFSTFIKTLPNFFTDVKAGKFHALNNWLQKNIYSHASSISTDDLVKKVTGESLNPIYFIDRIKKRYLKE
jgi:carboxypeptidase Taq